MRECGESVAGARGYAAKRDCRPPGARRQPPSARETVANRKRADCSARRSDWIAVGLLDGESANKGQRTRSISIHPPYQSRYTYLQLSPAGFGNHRPGIRPGPCYTGYEAWSDLGAQGRGRCVRPKAQSFAVAQPPDSSPGGSLSDPAHYRQPVGQRLAAGANARPWFRDATDTRGLAEPR